MNVVAFSVTGRTIFYTVLKNGYRWLLRRDSLDPGGADFKRFAARQGDSLILTVFPPSARAHTCRNACRKAQGRPYPVCE